MFYLDTSAAVKLVVVEKGSKALRRWLASHDGELVSSDLLRTELLRATRRAAPEHMVQERAVLDSLILVTLSTAVCERAAMLESHLLRSLDALHLAAALEVGDELEGLVTYDRRLAESARVLAAELWVLEGDYRRMLHEPDLDAAEEAYLSGLRDARSGGLHLIELKALTRLVGMRREMGRTPDCSDELASLYATFAEGLDEHDLVVARDLLG